MQKFSWVDMQCANIVDTPGVFETNSFVSTCFSVFVQVLVVRYLFTYLVLMFDVQVVTVLFPCLLQPSDPAAAR